nr:hypothetical protein [Tanacetum cinerariifolium]
MIERNFVEIHGAFLVKIRDNTFNGAIGENVFEHINKFLEVVGPIKINRVSQDQFRLSIFPISLTGAIGEWFKKDCIGSVTTWDDSVGKLVKKFYQLSDHNEEIKDDDDLDDIMDIFKIEGNLFDFETPLCEAFNYFNYLLNIDKDLFTFDIQGTRTYEEYELNNPVTMDLKEPWLDNEGIAKVRKLWFLGCEFVLDYSVEVEDNAKYKGFSGTRLYVILIKTPDLSQRSHQNCPKCRNPVNGHYCQGCAFLRKKFKEDLFRFGIEHGILQDSSELSNDNPNVVNTPREPFVVNQDPDNNSLQSPSQINHHCCYGCGDPLEVPFIYLEPCYNQDLNFTQEFHDFQQQDICCENCGVTHEAYRCQPKNLDYYHEQNSFYDSSSFGFDQFQPQQYTINHHVFNVQNELFDSQNKLMEQLTSMCDMVGRFIQKKEEEKKIEEEQATNARYWKIPACYDDDDDYAFAITPNEPVNSLSMGDEHLDTVSATKLDEFIKSNVENLILIPSESKGEPECDMPVCEEFTTFSNIFFDFDYDQSFSDEDLPKEIYLNPLFEEEIIPMKIDQHHYNAESDLIESVCTHDSSIIISSKIDSIFDEFAGELTLLKSIPPGVDETDCYLEEETHFIKRLFDSLMEEIDLSFTPDYLIQPDIVDDDYDSKRDILISEELLSNDSLSLPENESFHFDIHSFSPIAKPTDGNTGILNVKMMGDISEQKVPMLICS